MAIDWEREVLDPLAEVFGLEEWLVSFFPQDGTAPFGIKPVFDEAYREVILLDAMAPTTDAMPVMGVPRHYFKGMPRRIIEAEDWLQGCKIQMVPWREGGSIGVDAIGRFVIGGVTVFADLGIGDDAIGIMVIGGQVLAPAAGGIGEGAIGGMAIGGEPPRWYIVKEGRVDGHGNVKLMLAKTSPAR